MQNFRPGDKALLDLGNDTNIEVVWIPPGAAVLGDPKGSPHINLSPQRQVKFESGFWLGVYPITQKQYKQVTGSNPSKFSGADLPVESVSINGATAFCSQLSRLLGIDIRLPLSNEWEYACRAGTKTAFYFGDNESELDKYAWYGGSKQVIGNSGSVTHPVGQKIPNAWGLYDMLGNVWEMCGDKGVKHPKPELRISPAPWIITRGGSCICNLGACRAGNEGHIPYSLSYYDQGFRILVQQDGVEQGHL